jgi:NAD(P)-dependent dehydrogenase (short-subunit alcohol dehydrogenase family)
MEYMKGKIAIVTGATSGIGREVALLFASHGIKVAASGRDEKAGLSLIKEIISKQGEAIFIKTDVTNSQSVQNLIKETKKSYGGIDYAFNNAGIEGVLGSISDMEEEAWDNVINTNLKGLWLCLKYEFSEMILRRGGAIVNTSTNLTKLGLPGTSAYAASKAGVEALTQVAAIEYGKHGIRVNTISPGAVDTPMLNRIFNSEQKEQLKTSNPLHKIATPKEVAQTVLWLCSPMANHINGTNIFIDGGATLL